MATATITPDQNAVIAEIFIAAPPARVFQAISDPTQLPRWWGQDGLYRVTKSTMDLRPGGKWRSDGRGADGTQFYVEGEYLEVDPPRKLVYTWISSWMPTTTEVRWELEAQGNGTLLKLTHTGFAGNADQAKGHSTGWSLVLSWLQSFVEKGETVDTRS